MAVDATGPLKLSQDCAEFRMSNNVGFTEQLSGGYISLLFCNSPHLLSSLLHFITFHMKKYYLSEMTKDFSMIGAQRGESAVNSQSELAARSVAAKIAAHSSSKSNFFARFGREVHCSSRGLCLTGCPKSHKIVAYKLWILLFLEKFQAQKLS